MEQYENMSLEELLEARIELQKKRSTALQASNSLIVHQQFEMMLSEINHQIIMRQHKERQAMEQSEAKKDDLTDDILNIG
tara:strand:+ start:78 stop:317 length:240 start_codon:yes stop_codon:yes gene_type:complete